MSRRRLTALAGTAAAAALALGTPAGGASPTEEPKLRPQLLVGPLAPLRVRGVRFLPNERVRVTLDAGRNGSASTVATRAGTFTVAFTVRVPKCRTITIRAVGSRGSTAVRQLPRPNCREP